MLEHPSVPFDLFMNLIKTDREHLFDAAVVIAPDEDFSRPVKLAKEHRSLDELPQDEIAQVVDRVLGPYHGIPALDHLAVHLFSRAEGTPAVLDHVGVIEVRVAGEKYFHE
ncbi:MAG: hypothetical protein AAB425_12440 [Bdellovibrionota bacterium]